ncbi:MAG: Kazal-type serine protease inhibitor domain-containing protein, partial [Candidatus Micrarchaeota archaeon]
MGLYENLEDKYYAFMEKMHLVDAFVRPIEERGIPSMPIFALLIVLILALAGFAIWGAMNPTPPQPTGFRITVRSAEGELLNGALVEVWDGDTSVDAKTTNANGIALFDSLPLKTLIVSVSLEGYKTKEAEVDFTEKTFAEFRLESVGEETPTPTPDVWKTEDESKETLDAKLDVYVKNDANLGVDAIVRLFDADTEMQIGDDFEARGGHATFDNLEKGQKVYVNAEAFGSNANSYLPYNGRASKKTLSAGANTINARLVRANTGPAGQAQGATATFSTITVTDNSNAPVSRAIASVFTQNSVAVLATRTTESNGTALFVLPVNQSISYYATANKTGYFMGWTNGFFLAGENASITLTPITNDTKASLSVNVVDEKDGKAVVSASFSVYRSVLGQDVLLCRGTTNANGTGVCQGLQRGISVTVRAAKGARSAAEATVALAEAENSVALTLLLPRAKLICTAFDVVTNESIDSAQFTAYYGNASVGACSGAACEIVVPATVQLNLLASASDYTQANVPVTAAANENKTVSIALFPLDTINESRVVLQKVVDASSGLDVSSLRLGHVYTFVFTLASTSGDATGAFFSVNDANIAAITGHLQLGMQNLGSTSSACTPEEVDYESGKRYAWLDVSYYSTGQAVFTKTILLNVTVNENAPLDPKTHKAALALYYRSYVKKGNAIFRNPYDDVLGARVDSPLESGCFANTLEADYAVYSPATSCQKGVCVTLDFSQNGANGPNEGFPAKSLLNLIDGGTGIEPLLVRYKIEVFDDLQARSVLAFKWSDANAAELLAVSTPLQMEDPVNKGTWICGGASDYWFPTEENDGRAGEFAVYEDGTGFVLNLDKLTRCSNYAPPTRTGKPFVFRGAVFLKTLKNSAHVDVSARFASGSRKPPFWALVQPPVAEVAGSNALSFASANSVPARDLSAAWVGVVDAKAVEAFLIQAAPQPGGCYCEKVFEPVCGVDGKTYGNPCEAKCAGATVAYKGTCVTDVDCASKCAKKFAAYCDTAAQPPKLYYNDCFAKCDGVTSARQGLCGACYEKYAPVCGSDEVTYFNDCFAQLAGASVQYRAACKTTFTEYLFANHTTWFSVEGNGTYASDYAVVEIQFEQNTSAAANATTKKDNGIGMFEARSIEDCMVCPNDAANCDERNKIVAGNCSFGPVRIHFKITLRHDRDDNAIYLESTPDFLKLKEGGAYYYVGKEKTPRIAQNWFVEGFSDNLGTLKKGTVIKGTALAFPLKQGHSAVRAGHLMQDEDDPNAPFKTELQRSVYVTKKPGAPTTQLIPFKYTSDLLDSCNGAVSILYDASMSPDQSLRLANDCFSVQMRVSTIMPGDAIPVTVNSNSILLAKIVAGDADSVGCYETCDYAVTKTNEGKNDGAVSNCKQGIADAFTKKGTRLLRYNAELASCPKKFQVIANTINGSYIKVELRSPGSSEAVKTLLIYVDGAENYPCIVVPNVGQCVSRGPASMNCYYDSKEKACKIKYNDFTDARSALPQTINKRNAWTWGKSLYIGRIMTEYRLDFEHSETTKEWPELWVVVNHKQVGTRDIAIVDRLAEQPASVLSSDGLALDLPIVHFDGPGVKVFAWIPRPGRRMIAYEKREPIFYSDYDLKDPVQWVDDSNEYVESTLPDQKTLNLDSDAYALLKTNSIYIPEAAEIVIGRGQRLANTTAFWRSLESTQYCYCSQTPCDINAQQLADANLCKASLEDWRVYDSNTSVQYHGCTFCNNTAFPSPEFTTPAGVTCDSPQNEQFATGHLPCTNNPNIPVFDCDERCVQSDPNDPEAPGMAFIQYGSVIDEKACELANYAPAHPLSLITLAEVVGCQASGACPLLLDAQAKPQCFRDQDADGFYTEADSDADPELRVTPATLSAGAYSCATNGEIIAVSDFCNSPCMNWCTNRQECDLACGTDGTVAADSQTVKTQVGWLNEKGEIALDEQTGLPDLEWGLNNVKPVSVKQPDAPTLWHAPFSYFSDYRPPQFEYSFLVNAVNKHDSFFNLSSIKSVTGCNDVDHKKYEEQGVYEIKEHNDLDLYKITGEEQWKGEAAVLTLAKADYLGGRCNKPAAWNKVELCNPLFTDNTGWESYWKFGNCVNTIYQYEAGSTGALSKKVLWGRLASTEVKDVFGGFVISPQGYILSFANYAFKGAAWTQPFYTNADQNFEYWTPDGKAHLFSVNHRKVHWNKIATLGAGVVAGAIVGAITGGAGWALIPVLLASGAAGGATVGLIEISGGGCWGGNTAYACGTRTGALDFAAAPLRARMQAPALLALPALLKLQLSFASSSEESKSTLSFAGDYCSAQKTGFSCMNPADGTNCITTQACTDNGTAAWCCTGGNDRRCCKPKTQSQTSAKDYCSAQKTGFSCMNPSDGTDCITTQACKDDSNNA